MPAFDLVPQSNVWVSSWALLGLLLPIVLVAALLFVLYWVIRRAVTAGIGDARREDVRKDIKSAPLSAQ